MNTDWIVPRQSTRDQISHKLLTQKTIYYKIHIHMNKKIISPLIFIVVILTNSLIADSLSNAGAKYICKTVIQNNRKAVAIFPVTNKDDEQNKSLDQYTAKITSFLLTCQGIKLVESNQVTTLLKQQATAQSGLIDAKSAPKIGKLIGADTLVFNKLIINSLEIRMVDATTGEIIGARLHENTSDSAQMNKIPVTRIVKLDKQEASDGFSINQVKRILKRMFINKPGLFIYTISTDAEVEQLKSRHPRFAKNFFHKFASMPSVHQENVKNLRNKVLQIRNVDNKYDRHAKILKKRAFAKLRKRRRNR